MYVVQMYVIYYNDCRSDRSLGALVKNELPAINTNTIDCETSRNIHPLFILQHDHIYKKYFPTRHHKQTYSPQTCQTMGAEKTFARTV